MEITILGCGGSLGVPIVGCDCYVCSSNDHKNSRTRTSIIVSYRGKTLLVDTSPDIREQLLANNSCTALFYDNKRKMQLRVFCESIINYKNNLSSQVWDKTALQSRKCYMGKYSPSKSIEKWHPNIPRKYLDCQDKGGVLN